MATDNRLAAAERVLDEAGAEHSFENFATVEAILQGKSASEPGMNPQTPKHRWGFRISMVAAAFVPYTLLWSQAPVEAWTAFGFPAFFVVGAWWVYWQGRGWPHRWLAKDQSRRGSS